MSRIRSARIMSRIRSVRNISWIQSETSHGSSPPESIPGSDPEDSYLGLDPAESYLVFNPQFSRSDHRANHTVRVVITSRIEDDQDLCPHKEFFVIRIYDFLIDLAKAMPGEHFPTTKRSIASLNLTNAFERRECRNEILSWPGVSIERGGSCKVFRFRWAFALEKRCTLSEKIPCMGTCLPT